jgi:hypothetical protein
MEGIRMDLVGVREVAALLGWDQRKVSVYFGRGKLPEPIARLAAGPVWDRVDIERFKSGDVVKQNTDYTLPLEHVRAILWAYFEAARTGLLQPPTYGDPLPWMVDGKPSRTGRSLPGLHFAEAYSELWPRFLQAFLEREDLPTLLHNPAKLWDEVVRVFDKERSAWELRPKPVKETPLAPTPTPMLLGEACRVLDLLTDRDGPLPCDLDAVREKKLAQASDLDEKKRIWEAWRVVDQALKARY